MRVRVRVRVRPLGPIRGFSSARAWLSMSIWRHRRINQGTLRLTDGSLDGSLILHLWCRADTEVERLMPNNA